MITDADIKKMKAVFATKEDLKKFITKDEFKVESKKFATKEAMNNGFIEIIEFIGEVKSEIMTELNEFRVEIRDINRNNQSVLNNHETRIAHLEYTNKS
jgi:hypothetical protein